MKKMKVKSKCIYRVRETSNQDRVVSESDAWTAAGYLDSHTVISHGDTGIAVPTDMYGSVGPVVALPVQGATRRMNVLFGLLL